MAYCRLKQNSFLITDGLLSCWKCIENITSVWSLMSKTKKLCRVLFFLVPRGSSWPFSPAHVYFRWSITHYPIQRENALIIQPVALYSVDVDYFRKILYWRLLLLFLRGISLKHYLLASSLILMLDRKAKNFMEQITKRFGFWIVTKYREIAKSYFLYSRDWVFPFQWKRNHFAQRFSHLVVLKVYLDFHNRLLADQGFLLDINVHCYSWLCSGICCN